MSIPKTLDANQCKALIDELFVGQGTKKQLAKSCRNVSMAHVMLETGIRVGELCGLRVSDLWFAEQPVENLLVRAEIAKNKEERQIPISVKLHEAINIMHAILWSAVKVAPGSYAFFAKVHGCPLTTRSVERIILSAGKAAFNMDVTPHMLRHTFASRMMRKTNARTVQALLGHESLQSTQIYMHPNLDDLKKAINSKDEPVDPDYR